MSDPGWYVIYQKTSLTGMVIELFSTFYISVKYGGPVSATAQQQTYCASNSEQGSGEPEVPTPSVLRKAKYGEIQGSFQRWRNPLDVSSLMDRAAEIEIGMKPDTSFVSSVLVRSTIVKGSLALNISV